MQSKESRSRETVEKRKHSRFECAEVDVGSLVAEARVAIMAARALLNEHGTFSCFVVPCRHS